MTVLAKIAMPAGQLPSLDCQVQRIGHGMEHQFFGYYNKTPWDPSGRYLLCQRAPMMTGDLTGKEVAQIICIDSANNYAMQVVGETTTWNWQMGAQLQWLEGLPGRQIIYNTRAPDRRPGSFNNSFRATITNLDDGETRHLPLPIYVIARDSSFGLSINFSRLEVTHKTIGYRATGPEPELALAPEDDGIVWMDLATGENRLIVSLAQLCNHQPRASMDKAIHWVTHLEINPSGTRFLFIHRWTERVEDETCFLHRLYSCNSDGSGLQLLECSDHPLPQLADDFDPSTVGTFDYEKSEYQISHPLWRDDDTLIVWGPHMGEIGYHLYDVVSGEVARIGHGVLTENGHMTYSADGKWLLSDTYPDSKTNIRKLLLWDAEKEVCHCVGDFYTSPDLGKHNRCDLHPRWSRDHRFACIDSVHEGFRSMYLVDLRSVVLRETEE